MKCPTGILEYPGSRVVSILPSRYTSLTLPAIAAFVGQATSLDVIVDVASRVSHVRFETLWRALTISLFFFFSRDPPESDLGPIRRSWIHPRDLISGGLSFSLGTNEFYSSAAPTRM